jgi:competence protein ComEC
MLCGERHLGGVVIDVLHPCSPGLEALSENDMSLVLRITYGRFSLLLPGDIEEEAEATLVEKHLDGLRADVLKVPHHGSDTSSTESFLDAVRPRLAVVSCGASERRPLPAPEVAARLRRQGALVVSTAELGAIEVKTDGQIMRARSARSGALGVSLEPTPNR